MYGTPTMYIDMLTVLNQKMQEDPDILEKMSCLERFYTGGACCLPEIISKLRTYFKGTNITVNHVNSASNILFLLHDSDWQKLKDIFIVPVHYSLDILSSI